MKIEGLKKDTAVWVRGYADEFGGIDFLDDERSGLIEYLSEDNISYMSESDFRLDEPEPNQPKPEVTQFMVDWVNNSRERHYDFDEWFDCDNQPMEVYKWLNCKNKRQADLNALALVTLIVNGPDAVTIEKEKLYNVNVLGCTLFKMTSDNHVRYKLIGKNETPPESKFDSYEFEANLTEKEIKQADERLWQFAKSAF